MLQIIVIFRLFQIFELGIRKIGKNLKYELKDLKLLKIPFPT
jgi:hypothetical protein